MKNLGDMFFLLLKSIIAVSVLSDDRFPNDRQTFVGTKLNPFKKKLKGIHKTKSKLAHFLDKEFLFFIKYKDSPRKRDLKKTIGNLEYENFDITSANKEATAKVERLENELTEKNEEIDSLEARLVALKNDKVSLNQRI